MKGMNLVIRFFSLAVLFLFITACHTTIQPSDCVSAGGHWLGSYKECEDVSQAWCESSKGKFKPCESVCRHAPVQGPCIMQCVEVCKL